MSAPDRSLPQSEHELRDWLAAAWEDGWTARRSLVGRPMGTVIAAKRTRLDTFLLSWDLPPLPKPPDVTVNHAIRALGEEEGKDDPASTG